MQQRPGDVNVAGRAIVAPIVAPGWSSPIFEKLSYWFHRYIVDNATVRFTVVDDHKKPLLPAFFLIAVFIWIAENVATFTDVWLYPGQRFAWTLVSPNKLVAWFLLMIVSFVLVSHSHRGSLKDARRVDGAKSAMLQ